MLKLFKKLFRPKKTINQDIYNIDLIDKLSNIIYIDNLEQLLFSPIAKIYILNVYNDTFEDLLANLLIKDNNKQIISINIHSYFKDKNNIRYKLKRIIPILEVNKIHVKVEHELTELIDTIEYMANLERKKNGKQS